MNKSYYARHQDLMKTVILEGQKHFPTLRLFPATNGLFYTKQGTPVKIGTNGMPDLFGFITVNKLALMLFVEIKSGKAGIKKGSDQDKFRKLCLKFNAIHLVIRNPSQFKKELEIEINKRKNLELLSI